MTPTHPPTHPPTPPRRCLVLAMLTATTPVGKMVWEEQELDDLLALTMVGARDDAPALRFKAAWLSRETS